MDSWRYHIRSATWFKLIIMGLIGLVLMVGINHNQHFYHQSIAKVTHVSNGRPQPQIDGLQNKDELIHQRLTAKMINGRHEGETIVLNNSYSHSYTTDFRFHPGSQIFVSQVHRHDQQLAGTISGVKRDATIAFLAWLVVTMLVLLMGSNGLKALLSVVVNTILFIFGIYLDQRVVDSWVLAIFAGLTILFAATSLILILGWNKKMLATLLATLIGVATSVLLGDLILHLTDNRGVFYESMQYVTQVPKTLFIAELMLGSLGAVMDECSDIIATLFELRQLNPQISRRQLFSAGQNVGKEIMGPLINVLFLIFMAGTFASSILYLKNGNGWGYTFNMNMSLGMVQSLISGIGISLVVPLVSGFGALLLGRSDQ